MPDAGAGGAGDERAGELSEKIAADEREGARLRALASFDAVLNSHGQPFQFAVLRKIRDSVEQQQSGFVFEVSEFPVEVQGASTRIDFILRQAHSPLYLVCECKRVNPALADWCFVRAPFVRRGSASHPFVLEALQVNRQTKPMTATSETIEQYLSFDPTHFAFEIRHQGASGDKHSSGRGAIEEAATQVLRGLNGLISFAHDDPRFLDSWFRHWPGDRDDTTQSKFVPVIFTTANLYLSHADLSEADVQSGKVEIQKAKFEQKDWLCLQYHQSPALKHGHQLGAEKERNDLGSVLQREFVRTIPIVSPSGILSFLNRVVDLVY